MLNTRTWEPSVSEGISVLLIQHSMCSLEVSINTLWADLMSLPLYHGREGGGGTEGPSHAQPGGILSVEEIPWPFRVYGQGVALPCLSLSPMFMTLYVNEHGSCHWREK